MCKGAAKEGWDIVMERMERWKRCKQVSIDVADDIVAKDIVIADDIVADDIVANDIVADDIVKKRGHG